MAKTNTLRRIVRDRDGYKCAYCLTEEPPLTLDHVKPKARGGDNAITNLVLACKKCNGTKGDRLPDEIGMKLQVIPRALTEEEQERILPPRNVRTPAEGDLRHRAQLVAAGIIKPTCPRCFQKSGEDGSLCGQCLEYLAKFPSERWAVR